MFEFRYIENILKLDSDIIGKSDGVLPNEINQLEEQDKKNLMYGLRCKRLYEVPSSILVKGDSGNIYALKIRPNFEHIQLEKYTHYNNIEYDYTYGFRDIMGKFIIIDKKHFNMRGKILLEKL